jgi:transcriptional regulator with XRE-family HTH domain
LEEGREMKKVQESGTELTPTQSRFVFRHRLRARRVRLRLTEEEVAERTDLSPGLVRNLERGGYGLTVARAETLAKVLDCTADFLLGVGLTQEQFAVAVDMSGKPWRLRGKRELRLG